MDIKKYCRQPRILVKAQRKYPCLSTALIIGVFISLLLTGEGIAAKDSIAHINSPGTININISTLDKPWHSHLPLTKQNPLIPKGAINVIK